MAEKETRFKNTVENLFDGMRSMDTMLSAKTVVGEPTTIGDTVIIPLVDVQFGLCAGAGTNGTNKKSNGVGAIGGKLSPSSILVIKDGKTKIINIKDQDSLTKLIDIVPEIVDRFTKPKEGEPTKEDIIDAAFPEEE